MGALEKEGNDLQRLFSPNVKATKNCLTDPDVFLAASLDREFPIPTTTDVCCSPL